MPVLYQPDHPELLSSVTNRNLTQQYHLLETIVEVALSTKERFSVTPDLLFALHTAASLFLDDTPGQLRTDFVYIENSKHVPSEPNMVQPHLNEFFRYLNSKLSSGDMIHLAAFTLWRITWIHPFNECNGRTARALCYLILCIKSNQWLIGQFTIHTLIRENLEEYYDALADADQFYAETGDFHLEKLERYLIDITYSQIVN
jgi:Fic family protein